MTRTYAESFELLREQVELAGEPRPHVTNPPRHDDIQLGPTIFRYIAEDGEFQGLTLPGLYIGRSALISVSVAGSDLRLSRFNWSDFTGCDFTACNLEGSDLRACIFQDCSFRDADLRGADFRHSTFRSCSFVGARLAGARLVRPGWLAHVLGTHIKLSPVQRNEVAWSEPGPEPEGG